MSAAPGAAGNTDVVESVGTIGWRTNLALLRTTGSTITDRGDHLVVRTPTNPDFWWGNFLLLREPPPPERTRAWVVRFDATFPGAGHRAFGLDDPTAPAAAFAGFAGLGYEVERNAVMITRSVPGPARPTSAATFRALVDDSDWEQHVDLSLLVYPEPSGKSQRPFVEARSATQRQAVEAGAGVWVGAFVDGRLVSQLGVLRAGQGLGRYQDVETHPGFRRRGLAGALVARAGETVISELGVRTLVMVADPDDEAIRLYRSLGFVESAHQLEASISVP